MTNEKAAIIINLWDDTMCPATAEERTEAKKIAMSVLMRNRWISVKEKLPENDCNCIVFSNGDVKEAHFYVGKFFDPIEDYMQYNATHWMPLPEPPEKARNE